MFWYILTMANGYFAYTAQQAGNEVMMFVSGSAAVFCVFMFMKKLVKS